MRYFQPLRKFENEKISDKKEFKRLHFDNQLMLHDLITIKQFQNDQNNLPKLREYQTIKIKFEMFKNKLENL